MLINLKSQTELSGLYIVFDGSTNIEERGIYGISHLMEHLLCKNFESLRDDFERDGIDWNAYTSQNEIVFFFTGLESYLMKWRLKLIDMITNFDISKSQFENERKIILQEYKNAFSDQSECHVNNLSRKLFRDYNPIGLKEDLESLTYMNCLDFFEKQFKSPTKIINVSSGRPLSVDIDFLEMNVVKTYERGPFKDVILEPVRNFGDKVSLIMVSKLATEDFAYINFINTMLSSGLSSPLYSEVREKRGLVYHINCSQSRLNKQGVTMIMTESSDKNVELVFDTIENILNNPNKFLSKKRFEMIKKSYLIRYQKDRINRFQNVNHWINPPEWSVKNIIKTISYDKLIDVYERHFKYSDFYISNDRTEFS
jgi:predicted Zn-dependent peptidase